MKNTKNKVIRQSSVNAEITYRTGKWGRELAEYSTIMPVTETSDALHIDISEDLGNHRAIVSVKEKADAVCAHILWRRQHRDAAKENIIIIDSATGKPVKNRLAVNVGREGANIVFQPQTVPGQYEIYYMPCKISGYGWCLETEYQPWQDTAEKTWIANCKLRLEDLNKDNWQYLPEAELVEIQSRGDFNGFYPMEIIATEKEIRQLLTRFADSCYLLFPEDRSFPIRMTENLPFRWIKKGSSSEFAGKAQLGEFYVFQIGVYAIKELKNIKVELPDLVDSCGQVISARRMCCFNLSGVDWLGNSITKSMDVDKGKVQALWFGIDVPKDIAIGRYEGVIKIFPKNALESPVKFLLEVKLPLIEDHGDGDLWRLSRLRWLDSTIGLDDETVPAPYMALEMEERTVKILGRSIDFGDSGLPERVRSTFSFSLDSVNEDKREILSGPISFIVETCDGKIKWSQGKLKLLKKTHGLIVLESESKGKFFTLKSQVKVEFDGYINFRLVVTSLEPVKINNIYLEIPIKRNVAKHMMGMGFKGGHRPKTWDWHWDLNYANNMLWIGDVNAGLHLKLKGKVDSWEPRDFKSSGFPQNWENGGKGGCTINESGDTVLIHAYSGNRNIEKGQSVEFNFGLLITPLKMLDKRHWNWRYYHNGGKWLKNEFSSQTSQWLHEAKESRAKIINVHQGYDLNPFINYPFLMADKLSKYVKKAHEENMKVEIYYTVRELSNHATEIWALRSMKDEFFKNDPSALAEDPDNHKTKRIKGCPWLYEHLISGYVPAWQEPVDLDNGMFDGAIEMTGLSRWHNYYLEGLAWLLRKVKIDGLYLDGIGYDRKVMKRVRKIIERFRPDSLINFHGGNNFNVNLNSPAIQNMEHFPYIDSIWFGEGFNYDESPDYWLIEISGIPFGLFGEMLEGGGNPWRGMIYGMTNRLGWGKGDPRGIWKLWDEFGIADAEMIGYWVPNCPVKTDESEVLATVYVKNGKVLISIASWAKGKKEVALNIDWDKIGLNPDNAILRAPEVSMFQESTFFRPDDRIPVEPKKGWFLILEGKF